MCILCTHQNLTNWASCYFFVSEKKSAITFGEMCSCVWLYHCGKRSWSTNCNGTLIITYHYIVCHVVYLWNTFLDHVHYTVIFYKPKSYNFRISMITGVSWFETGIHLMKQFIHNWYHLVWSWQMHLYLDIVYRFNTSALGKMAAMSKPIFLDAFSWMKIVYFDWYFTEVCSQVSNWKYWLR